MAMRKLDWWRLPVGWVSGLHGLLVNFAEPELERRSRRGLQIFEMNRALYRNPMVKYGNGARIRVLLFNACINENGPTLLAIPLYAQAAMSPVTPFSSSVVQTPDAQQSKRIKTSERDPSSVF